MSQQEIEANQLRYCETVCRQVCVGWKDCARVQRAFSKQKNGSDAAGLKLGEAVL
jgi:hypothetical protein